MSTGRESESASKVPPKETTRATGPIRRHSDPLPTKELHTAGKEEKNSEAGRQTRHSYQNGQNEKSLPPGHNEKILKKGSLLTNTKEPKPSTSSLFRDCEAEDVQIIDERRSLDGATQSYPKHTESTVRGEQKEIEVESHDTSKSNRKIQPFPKATMSSQHEREHLHREESLKDTEIYDEPEEITESEPKSNVVGSELQINVSQAVVSEGEHTSEERRENFDHHRRGDKGDHSEEERTSGIGGVSNLHGGAAKIQKFPFKLQQFEHGNILTVHHTIKDRDKLIRIRMAACCFNNSGTKFVAVDKRGNIFVFDLVAKKFWRLETQVPKVTIIRQSLLRPSEYLFGTKLGQLLLIDITRHSVLKTLSICAGGIENISFPGQPLQPSHLTLVHAGTQAIIINLDKLKATHRLDFEDIHFSLKFACYIPHSEQIFTCFTNDAVHVWSGVTLNTLRVAHPIRTRDRKLKVMPPGRIPQISLTMHEEMYAPSEFEFRCQDQDYSNGVILAYAFSRDGSLICLTTVDKYLLLLHSHTCDIQRFIRLRDFTITACDFLPKPRETLIWAVTGNGQLLLIDCQHTEFKLLVHAAQACQLSVSQDGKLLAVLVDTGEAYIWSACKLYNMLRAQQHCFQMVQAAFKENKPLAVSCSENTAVDMDLKKLLKPDRLVSILMEFGCYPAKYRGVIWCSMLQLPCNRREYQQLVKMGIPNAIKERALKLKIKQDAQRRLLVQIWACLAHWCKVFAYSEFLPALIFPFTQVYSRNPLVAFELCVSLVLNHFQLWFEFHPLEPANYLGMCSNVLQCFDKELHRFYASLKISPTDYAWSVLSNAFSVVLDAEQWLCLWDHIVTYPIHFPIFCVVAYNVLQREVLLRLPNAVAIKQFFCEQNPIDVGKLVRKARCLMVKCPPAVHPQRYMRYFTPIPKGVYAKFLNYPKKWVAQHEHELEAYKRERRAIDARLRELELEEYKMMERLERGLKEEEHTKRIKEMEAVYQNTLKREEERIADQRKMLLLYQKEIRNRKVEVLTALQESERRKKSLETERELDELMNNVHLERTRNETELMAAEDELRNQEIELLAQRNLNSLYAPTLSQKYREEIKNLAKEKKSLSHSVNKLHQLRSTKCELPASANNLDEIERNLDAIYQEFQRLKKTN